MSETNEFYVKYPCSVAGALRLEGDILGLLLEMDRQGARTHPATHAVLVTPHAMHVLRYNSRFTQTIAGFDLYADPTIPLNKPVFVMEHCKEEEHDGKDQ